MLKNCNFVIFFITLGISSVAIARSFNDPENQDEVDSFHSFHSNLMNSMFSKPLQGSLSSPMGLGRSLSRNPSFMNGLNLDDHMSSIHSALSQLRNSGTTGQNINGPVTNTIKKKECCDNNGNNCRPKKEGENCDYVRKIKTSFSMMSGTIDPSKISTNDFGGLKQSSPTEDNTQISPQKSQRASSKEPPKRTEYDDDEASEQPSQSMSPLQKNSNSLNKQKLDPSLSLNVVGDDDDYEPDSLKLIDDSFGIQQYHAMPKEKPAQSHAYEKPSGLDDKEVDRIRQQVLDRTNYYRKRYGLSALVLNENMNYHAQEWANHLAPTHSIFHRNEGQNKIYGENIYLFSAFKDNIGEMCVDAWYQELRFVNVNDKEPQFQNNPRGVVGHLTALLWKRSKEMGVGVARDNKGRTYIVANYNPGGNVGGFYDENLPRFKQSDIDEAKVANEEHYKEHLAPKMVRMVMDPKTGEFVPADGSKLPPGMASGLLPIKSGMGSTPFSYGMGSFPFSLGMGSPSSMLYPLRSKKFGDNN